MCWRITEFAVVLVFHRIDAPVWMKLHHVAFTDQPQPAQELDTSKLNYVGDRALRASSRPTLHLRMLKLKQETVPAGEKSEEIPWIAVHMTESYAKDCIIEEL